MARPLTKRKKTGELYERPPDIETKIDVATRQDAPTLLRRIAVADPVSCEHLPSECLVHLIRNARRIDDENVMNALLRVVLSRCEKILKAKIPDSRIATAADLRDEILGQFSILFAIDGSDADDHELDFYECRFNLAFRKFWTDILLREFRHTKKFPQLPCDSEGHELRLDDAEMNRLAAAIRAPRSRRDDRQAELCDAIHALPPDEREAVALHHLMGYDIESENSEKVTVATLCGVTGRTIRNRLSRALERLARFMKDE